MQKVIQLIKKAVIVFILGGGLFTLILAPFIGVNDLGSFIYVGTWQGLVWVVLWIGNGSLNEYLSTKISWLEKPELRGILGVLVTVSYTILSITTLIIIRRVIVFDKTWTEAISMIQPEFFVSTLLITALIAMFLHSRQFLKEWRNSASEAERLRMENLSARYETLKNQVNPHFLFNSFNVLSTLVYKDPDQASKFIKQLSNLYRYVLETKDKETVKVEEELNALNSFSFLSKIRFGENLNIDIDLEEVKAAHIAPMTLQMLVENAIKHNIVSKAKPLYVKVFVKDDFIIVENNLQRKSSVRDSAGIGLPNIQARYEYLSDKLVQVRETNDSFNVNIPLLKL